MHKVLAKKQLAPEIFEITVEAGLVARARKAGQFVIVQVNLDWGERIPLAIADADPEAGTVTMVFRTAGASTHKLAAKHPGEYIAAVLGPLGNPTRIGNFGHVVCVGGGVGVVPLFPIAQALKTAGNRVTAIIGARTGKSVIFEDRMREWADELVLVTDDGSYGRKALVTEPLREFCAAPSKPDMAVAIGPAIMMKFCAEITAQFNVPVIVSLNTIMVDGTGMCGGCRVTVGGQTKFVCVDGPEFDGHQVDFDSMIPRMNAYRSREERDLHRCRVDMGPPPQTPEA